MSENKSKLRGVGDVWSSVRGVLQSYSTQGIKDILGKAGLPIFKIEYDGTYKGPFLDEADKLVRNLGADSRDKFIVGCIEEVVILEQIKATRASEQGRQPDNQILENLQEVLARVGYELSGRTIHPLN